MKLRPLHDKVLVKRTEKRKLHPEVLFFQDLLKKNLHKVK
jgi:co-chaperonin GroES (HSP10)